MLRNDLTTLPSRPEAYRSKLFVFLFLLSLAMFFAASISAYILIRANAIRDENIDYVPLEIPPTFWASTFFLVSVSLCLHMGCHSVRRERIKPFRAWLTVAAVLAVAFFIFQAFGMRTLLNTHFSRSDGATKSYGICFTLAFLHALHVLGGMIFLLVILFGTYRQKFDHERHWPVDNCANYWHFLDLVWFAMLLTFLIVR